VAQAWSVEFKNNKIPCAACPIIQFSATQLSQLYLVKNINYWSRRNGLFCPLMSDCPCIVDDMKRENQLDAKQWFGLLNL